MRDAALLAMAGDAGLPGGKNDVRGLTAVARIVAGGASNFEMFAMIESRADQPPVRDYRFGHLRNFIS